MLSLLSSSTTSRMLMSDGFWGRSCWLLNLGGQEMSLHPPAPLWCVFVLWAHVSSDRGATDAPVSLTMWHVVFRHFLLLRSNLHPHISLTKAEVSTSRMNRVPGSRLAKPLVLIISEHEQKQWWSVTEYIYSSLMDFTEVLLCYALILLNCISAFKYLTCTLHQFISYEAFLHFQIFK